MIGKTVFRNRSDEKENKNNKPGITQNKQINALFSLRSINIENRRVDGYDG